MNRNTDSASLALQFLPTQVAFQLPAAFGRRATATDIGSALLEPPRSLDSPPEDLSAAHDPALVQLLWSRLIQVVREPTQTIWTADIRWVLVTGVAVLAFLPDGTVHPYLHAPAEDRSSRLERLDPWNVVLQGCPYRDLWLTALARLARWDVLQHAQQRGVSLSDAQAAGYAQWAFAHFGRQLARHADLRQMRERVARVLAFEPAVVAMAARLPVTTRSDALIFQGAYNHVQRHRTAFDAVAREAPNLLPLFGALCDSFAFPEEGEAVARLRRFLVQIKGLSPRTWRYLCQAGSRVLKPLAEFYGGDVDHAALEHLKLLDQLAVDSQTPPWLVRTVLAGWGDADNRWASYANDVAKHPKLWAHLARTLTKAGPAQIELDKLDLVRRWIFDLPHGVAPDRQQRAGGWPWLVRQADEWAEVMRQKAAKKAAWSTWTETVSIGRWTLRPLNSALALWEEALAMRHCAEGFVGRCQSGGSVMFSVSEGTRRVATALMDKTRRGWRLNQVKCFANGAVSNQLAVRLEAWMAGLPATAENIEGADPVNDGDPVENEAEDAEAVGLDQGGAGEDDEAREEEDPAETDRRIVARACELAHVGDQDPDEGQTIYCEVEALLDRWNDQGDLSFAFGGRQVLHHQVRNWATDFDTWLERACVVGAITEERYEHLSKRRKPLKALLPEELAMFDEMFVKSILGNDDADYDVYGGWAVECLRDETGRTAWAVHRITGYSFTYVQLSLLGLCADSTGVKEILEEQGRYSGALPVPGNDLKGSLRLGDDLQAQRPGQGVGQ
jgi:hypothetical protein